MVKIYLDNCCYNRPFDNQKEPAIRIETQAKVFVQTLIRYGDIALTYSFISVLEIHDSPFEYNKEHILEFIERNAIEYVGSEKMNEVQLLVSEIMEMGVKAKDALHLACAIASNCDYFLTTDKRLLKYRTDKITLMNPVDFVKEWGDFDVH